MAALKWLLRVAAIGDAIAWAALCWRAHSGRESVEARGWRTALFVVALVCASLGWPTQPPKRGGRNKERL